MLDFYQKRKLRGLLLLPVTRVLLVVVVMFVAYSAYVRYEIAAEMKERRELAEKELTELQQQKRQLEEKVQYLSNERGIEAELRRQFDVTLPGEEVVVILDDEEEAVEPIRQPQAQKKSWYVFWE